MSLPYLSSRTTTLESTAPVEPAKAQAAQIPLESFVLPTFPPEAFTSNLGALILTSDIKMDEYSDILTQPFVVPDLPASIVSLTLELFALGFPAGFLSGLGEKLGDALVSLTLFEQLFGGTVPGSKEDAVAFIKAQTQLKEVHFLDVFAPKGFWADVARVMAQEAKFIEVGYTYRHEDPAFLGTLPDAREVAGFVKEGLVGLRLAMGAPIRTGDEEEGTEEGIMPIGRERVSDDDAAAAGTREAGIGSALVKSLVERGGGLVMLDGTMFELSVDEASQILDACGRLKIAAFSLTAETGWEDLFAVLGTSKRNVELLEIVGVPGEDWVERIKVGAATGLAEELLMGLGEEWKDLKSVKVSLLRTKEEEWVREGTQWEKKL